MDEKEVIDFLARLVDAINTSDIAETKFKEARDALKVAKNNLETIMAESYSMLADYEVS
jgi:predicted transcriptional regulator